MSMAMGPAAGQFCRSNGVAGVPADKKASCWQRTCLLGRLLLLAQSTKQVYMLLACHSTRFKQPAFAACVRSNGVPALRRRMAIRTMQIFIQYSYAREDCSTPEWHVPAPGASSSGRDAGVSGGTESSPRVVARLTVLPHMTCATASLAGVTSVATRRSQSRSYRRTCTRYVKLAAGPALGVWKTGERRAGLQAEVQQRAVERVVKAGKAPPPRSPRRRPRRQAG
eukprot:364850-Chlamydomonas_euryale.AAC.6